MDLNFFSVFIVTEQLSITLQAENTTLKEAKYAALLTESYLRKQRSDTAYDEFYDKESHNIIDDSVLPRQRKVPRHLDSGTGSHEYDSQRSILDRSIMKYWMS